MSIDTEQYNMELAKEDPNAPTVNKSGKPWIWVVRLEGGSRRNPYVDKIIVRAGTEEQAIKCALKNYFGKTKIKYATAWHANPITDLCCQTREEFLKMSDSMRRSREHLE